MCVCVCWLGVWKIWREKKYGAEVNDNTNPIAEEFGRQH